MPVLYCLVQVSKETMARSIIVLPDDSSQPIHDAIAAAKKTIRIKMFLFSDRKLMRQVAAAKRRGVDVRVMLNPVRRNGKKQNGTARRILKDAGVEVKDSNPIFDLTHEKSMVIDEKIAFVQSVNWSPENFGSTRDYAIVTSNKHEVKEVAQCFDADWEREEFESGEGSRLIWCTGNGRLKLAEFIDSAKRSLWLQNERYQDPTIIEHLIRAHVRGVKIHIMAKAAHKLKKSKIVEGVSGLRSLEDLGVKIHKLKHIKLHAKLLFADNKRAIIGSINLTPGSFDSRRELAIEVKDEHIIKRIKKTLKHDWKNSHKMDLSDKGLIKELAKYDPEVNEHLGIPQDAAKKKKE